MAVEDTDDVAGRGKGAACGNRTAKLIPHSLAAHLPLHTPQEADMAY